MQRTRFRQRAVSLLVLTGLLSFRPLPAMASAQAPLAVLKEVEGRVEILPANRKTWLQATPGMALNVGDEIKTQAKSEAILLRSDGSVFELYPLSVLSLSSDRSLSVTLGRLWSKFQKVIGAPNQILTPSSIALIRGTILRVSAYGPTSSRVVVTEGLVEVKDRAGHHEDVAAGFQVQTDQDGHLAQVEKASKAELAESRQFVEKMDRDRLLKAPNHSGGGAKGNAARTGNPGDDRAVRSERPSSIAHVENMFERSLSAFQRADQMFNRTRNEDVLDRRAGITRGGTVPLAHPGSSHPAATGASNANGNAAGAAASVKSNAAGGPSGAPGGSNTGHSPPTTPVH